MYRNQVLQIHLTVVDVDYVCIAALIVDRHLAKYIYHDLTDVNCQNYPKLVDCRY